MANRPDIDCTSELYIEADSKLSAMATFLDELAGDARARKLLASMVRDLEAVVSAGLEAVDAGELDDHSLRRDLRRLREAVEALPEERAADPHIWQQLRQSHRQCRKSFSQLMDALFEGPRHHRSGLATGGQFNASA